MTGGVDKLRVRRLREQLAATGQYLSDLEAPLREEIRTAPVVVKEGFANVLAALDSLDRALAKIDGGQGAVGGGVALREEWA